jgi:hypothetical protein
MLFSTELTTAKVLDVFTEVITAHGGRVLDTFDDKRHLFTRSVLPRVESLRPGDRVQGGVALRTTDTEVAIHPYLFRLVCTNGAIMTQALATERLAELHLLPADDALRLIGEAVEACCAEEVFTTAAGQMRLTVGAPIDAALNLLPMFSQMAGAAGTQLFLEIMKRVDQERDVSHFGLVNAVTSLARDTRDPHRRWALEDLGGALISIESAPLPTGKVGAAADRREGLLVG